MPTDDLVLTKRTDGYYQCRWWGEDGKQRSRTFGKNRERALVRFAAFRQRWLNSESVRGTEDGANRLTCLDLWTRFAAWAAGYYVHANGTPTQENVNIRGAFQYVLDAYGDRPVDRFGPKQLKALRVSMATGDRPLCRNVINQRVRKIRQVFKWGVSEGLVEASVWHALQTVQAIDAGRSLSNDQKVVPRESQPVTPVPVDYVEQTIARVSPTIGAMIKVQMLTGMRPGEVCQMRPCDLVVTGDVWEYRPAQHKTQRHARQRVILIGPRAQVALKPFLNRAMKGGTQVYIFSPRQAERDRYDACRVHRHQPVPAARTQRRLGERYTTCTYYQAISDGCRKPLDGCDECQEQGQACDAHLIPMWGPNRLRHNAATELRRRFGIDTARAALGHSTTITTEIYAEMDVAAAKRAMAEIG